MKTISFNTYCKKLDKLAKELTADVHLFAEHSNQFASGSFETTKDARIRLEALSSLKNTARRINSLLQEIEPEQTTKT